VDSVTRLRYEALLYTVVLLGGGWPGGSAGLVWSRGARRAQRAGVGHAGRTLYVVGRRWYMEC